VLTDHDTIDGARALLQSGEPVIVGQEVMTSQGELMGLFLEKAVPAGMSPEDTVAAIKEQGGLVCLQHPYDSRRRNLQETAIERIASAIDLVEVMNGRSTDAANRRAMELRQTLGVPGGAGSDAHSLSEIGRIYVEVQPFTGPRDFLVNLRDAKIVVRRRRVF